MINILSFSFNSNFSHSVLGTTFSFTAKAVPFVLAIFNDRASSEMFFPENCLGSELTVRFIVFMQPRKVRKENFRREVHFPFAGITLFRFKGFISVILAAAGNAPKFSVSKMVKKGRNQKVMGEIFYQHISLLSHNDSWGRSGSWSWGVFPVYVSAYRPRSGSLAGPSSVVF